MNDDIVTRLRNEVCECGYSASFNELHKCLWCEAADEIERLGELLFQEIYNGQEKVDEIERLEGEVRFWRETAQQAMDNTEKALQVIELHKAVNND